jgi:hypothetical protein
LERSGTPGDGSSTRCARPLPRGSPAGGGGCSTARTPMRYAALLTLSLLLAACGDGPAEPAAPAALPSIFRLSGHASGSDATGRTADCALDLIFELPTETHRTPGRVEYRGTHGGEARRTVLDREGNGFAFSASVFGEVEARLFIPDSVELIIPSTSTSRAASGAASPASPGTSTPTARARGGGPAPPSTSPRGTSIRRWSSTGCGSSGPSRPGPEGPERAGPIAAPSGGTVGPGVAQDVLPEGASVSRRAFLALPFLRASCSGGAPGVAARR